MDRLIVGRTTFMIAHRLSTLDHCELVVEIHDARLHVVRQGAVIDVTERDLDGRILYGT
jgi:ABC-type multidrug transport system fused ATPase/permease subunit